ncbi:hemolysin XhlA family protein [Thermoactinomyces sp. CICC 10521]|uniref:hemolysin XhlA family protein n=1 Tax=Thermoactinomyces sp. CICC 10521 TaxID=2767426 RepID=UPI0018DC5909|nr:hemolysin XhlA family protein [Thermoactinomyces sp. CICC 10521]MBH8609433.1 hemolysin XhlA family protein [Thermoactinomyces sp. CICC 10521]
MGENNGVVISIKEMYATLQEVSRALQRIESRLDKLEGKVEIAYQADERSRAALNKAEDALELAQKVESQIAWLWRTAIGALIVGAIEALFYISHLN